MILVNNLTIDFNYGINLNNVKSYNIQKQVVFIIKMKRNKSPNVVEDNGTSLWNCFPIHLPLLTYLKILIEKNSHYENTDCVVTKDELNFIEQLKKYYHPLKLRNLYFDNQNVFLLIFLRM